VPPVAASPPPLLVEPPFAVLSVGTPPALGISDRSTLLISSQPDVLSVKRRTMTEASVMLRERGIAGFDRFM